MSSNKLFVGGLSWDTDHHGLRDAFDEYGNVIDAKVITERDTGRSRGFGFVTFESPDGASSAMSAMDGASLAGFLLRSALWSRCAAGILGRRASPQERR
jgi:RNA recognition motif-containing protein